jgi:hypothetical protein
MNCAFDGGAFDSVAFDVCIPTPSPSTFRVGGGGNYDPFYWDRIRRKREEEEFFIIF